MRIFNSSSRFKVLGSHATISDWRTGPAGMCVGVCENKILLYDIMRTNQPVKMSDPTFESVH